MKPRISHLPAPNPLILIEQALLGLRAAPWLLACHLVGSVPFAAALVGFVNDMAHHPLAARRCAPFALVVALAFVWCQTWHAAFATALREAWTGERPRPWTPGRIWAMARSQVILQAPAFLALAAAALLILPLPWVVAWFQNLTVLADATRGRLRALACRAWVQTFLWPAQNLALFLILAFLSAAVVCNLAAALLATPILLKRLTGIDTHLTLSLASAVNTTFLSVVAGLSWMVLDPVVKAVHVLRSFQGESLATGADLQRVLRQSRPRTFQPPLLVLVIAGALAASTLPLESAPAAAAEDPVRPPPAALATDSRKELDAALDEVLARPAFAWRTDIPPASDTPAEGGQSRWEQWSASVREGIESAARRLRDWGRAVLDWIEKALTRRTPRPPAAPWLSWQDWPRLLMAAGALAVAAVLGWMLWIWVRRRATAPAVVDATPIAPDIADEEVRADQLPESSWRHLAEELFRSGQTRLALRALYLACLAHLAQRNLLQISRAKSNQEYLREIRRRASDLPDLVHAFERLVLLVERVWYGAHRLPPEGWSDVEAEVRRICA